MCAGRGKVACDRCKYMIPKYEDLVKESDCIRCEKKGTAFRDIRFPCPFCLGIGMILKPSATPDRRAGVPE